jgi:prepilin-type N-terminal cleavage/methylation domain-containing protein
LNSRRAAVSLIELLCVVAILAILVSLNLGAVLRACKKVRAFLDGN